MQVEKILAKACCGKYSIIFKLDRPITKQLVAFFVSNGFTEASRFTQSGLLYVDNLDFTLTGSIGANKIHVLCKMKDYTEKLNKLEELLFQME